MATETVVKPLRDSLNSLAVLLDKELVTRSSWGELTFEDASLDFDRIRYIVANLRIMPLEILTDSNIAELNGVISEVTTRISSIDNFKIVDNAVSQRTKLLTEIHTVADKLSSLAGPLIPFLAYNRGDVAANIEKLSNSVLTAQELIEGAKNQANKELEEIKKVSAEARAAAAKAGAAHFRQDFEEEAASNKKTASRWLIATITAAISTILAALSSLLVAMNNPALTNVQALQILVAKLIVLSVFFTITVWCGRLYRASLHQAATNRHRALSLTTFTAFTAAASDEQTKNAVLIETTRSIFGVTSTGYLDEKGSDESIRVIEVIKAIGQTKTIT